jgi:hypothetical protein
MSASTTTCPKGENTVGVSTTTRPVTHVALTDVKAASIHDSETPRAEEMGSSSSSVPTAQMAAKDTTSTRAGLLTTTSMRSGSRATVEAAKRRSRTWREASPSTSSGDSTPKAT